MIDNYGAYPEHYMVKNAYFWNNLVGGVPATDVAYIENPTYTQKDREYFMYKKPGYTPYTYPHPLRCLTSPPSSDTVKPIVSSFDVQPRNTMGSTTITWTATDNQALTQIRVVRTTDLNNQPDVSGWTAINTRTVSGTQNTSQYVDTLIPGIYWYGLQAVDSAGNIGYEPAPIRVVVSTADTTPPSAPTNLSVTVVSTSQINLSWTASTDNAGVTSYRIYRGGTQIAISTTTSYQNTGLSPSTAYTYTVAAYDAAGNVSGQSNQTLATTPPSAPCVGTCKTNSCSSYTNCTSASGTCSSGYCCSGACTALLTQPPGQPGVGGTGGNIIEFKNPLTYENLDDLISGIADLLKILAIAGGLIMVILSGIMIMTAGGKEEQVTKGKKMLMWTLIGVAIALSAGFIIDLVQELLK